MKALLESCGANYMSIFRKTTELSEVVCNCIAGSYSRINYCVKQLRSFYSLSESSIRYMSVILYFVAQSVYSMTVNYVNSFS
jgi:hypothetical protein